ncbi:snapalysin family zinc-dependent metalloprotease [Streptomyces sp. 8K308]|uniref:snapalysin family zinc-dependent metalloprotease n=1 Tax=Streptomyces sp. 8K308 TaxID=2530388 RepID=UPI001FB5BE0F|nr:snapalysin family zinc-dependent metalloprotease [Streptomyces sp. 8K308]
MAKAARVLLTTLLAALLWTGGQAVAAPQEAAGRPLVATVLTYDASGSAEFASAVASGAAIWNESVTSVDLVPVQPGQRANIRIVADNGWPRAQTTSLGNGTVWMGRQAVDQGYNTVRIAAHELGHILGLPDIKPGPCSSLMSGSTAGVSCTNASPNSSERSRVESAFGGSLAVAAPATYLD